MLIFTAALAAQPGPKEKPDKLIDVNDLLPKFVADATKPDDKDSPLRKLQKERARDRAIYIEKTKEVIKIGGWDQSFFEAHIKTQVALAENLAELMDKPADKVKCYEMRVEALKEFEKFIANLVELGKNRPTDLNIARAARIDAEIELLKLKGPEEKPAAADDPEALIKQVIAELKTLGAAIENKDPAEKIKAAAQKLKGTTDKLKALKLPKDEDERLKKKYEKEIQDATAALTAAAMKNFEGAKILGEILK
jgi:hypothetical protein